METAANSDPTVPTFDCEETPNPPIPGATGCLRKDRPLDAQVRYLSSDLKPCVELGYCMVALFNTEG